LLAGEQSGGGFMVENDGADDTPDGSATAQDSPPPRESESLQTEAAPEVSSLTDAPSSSASAVAPSSSSEDDDELAGVEFETVSLQDSSSSATRDQARLEKAPKAVQVVAHVPPAISLLSSSEEDDEQAEGGQSERIAAMADELGIQGDAVQRQQHSLLSSSEDDDSDGGLGEHDQQACTR